MSSRKTAPQPSTQHGHHPARYVPYATLASACVLAVCVMAGAGVVYASSAGVFPTHIETLSPGDYVDDVIVPGPTPQTLPSVGLAPEVPLPDAARIQAAIRSVSREDVGDIGLSVLTLDGQVLADEAGTRPMTPASSLKVLSCLTALSILGPEHRFTTTVVSSPDGIVLVGGGDPYLEYASDYGQEQGSIHELADLTVAALGGKTDITLGYDESLFAGPAWNPTWDEGYRDDVTPISSLWVDGGFTDGIHEQAPAHHAAQIFADLLRERGVTVTQVIAAKAPDGAEEIAVVHSMPLRNTVARILSISDNSATEVILKQASLAKGGDGSFASAVATAREALTDMGIWMESMAMADGSGLSLDNWVPANALARAIVVAYSNPRLSTALAGLPVGGVSGTLRSRFNDDPEAGGRGVVHAKTGNHDGVCSMTGFVQTQWGGVVAFSLIANNSWDMWATQDWIDRVTTVIAAI